MTQSKEFSMSQSSESANFVKEESHVLSDHVSGR